MSWFMVVSHRSRLAYRIWSVCDASQGNQQSQNRKVTFSLSKDGAESTLSCDGSTVLLYCRVRARRGAQGKEQVVASSPTTPRDVVRQAAKVVSAGFNAVTGQPGRSVRAPGAADVSPSRDLAADMQALLTRAIRSGSDESRGELFGKILDLIVPDEARIISALADGSSATLVSVHARNRAGLVSTVVLENMSLVGRTANLSLPHLTPTYVSHLLALGILESGPEDSDLKGDYEVLAAEVAVLTAIKRAARGPLPARVTRGVVRLSGLGLELCIATGLRNA